jgi:hypothetical protein
MMIRAVLLPRNSPRLTAIVRMPTIRTARDHGEDPTDDLNRADDPCDHRDDGHPNGAFSSHVHSFSELVRGMSQRCDDLTVPLCALRPPRPAGA